MRNSKAGQTEEKCIEMDELAQKDFTYRQSTEEKLVYRLAVDSETITNSGDGDSTTRTAVCNIALPPHDAHTERSTESGKKSWKQRFRSLQTTVPDVRNVRSGRQHGTIRANP